MEEEQEKAKLANRLSQIFIKKSKKENNLEEDVKICFKPLYLDKGE